MGGPDVKILRRLGFKYRVILTSVSSGIGICIERLEGAGGIFAMDYKNCLGMAT